MLVKRLESSASQHFRGGQSGGGWSEGALRMRLFRFSVSAALLLSAASCSSDKTPPGGTPPEVDEASATRVRRMTRAEYDNSVNAIFPTTVPLVMTYAFAPEDTILGFSTHDRLQVTSLLADQIDVAANNLAEYGKVQLRADWTCAADVPELECAEKFIRGIASHAYRRPVTDDEVADFLVLWQESSRGTDPGTGARMVLQGIFSSASFLYRTELGAEGAGANQVVRMTPHEVATALAFAITAGPADAELLAAAEAGQLDAPDEREKHARRLLATPAAQRHLYRFVEEWIGITGQANLTKNNQVFPVFSAAFKVSSQAETRAFINHILKERNGSVRELLNADYTYADARMAYFYGTQPSMPDGTLGRLPLPSERAGILTHASVLATYALFDSSSPIRRGKFIMHRLLCREVPPPPATISIIPPEPVLDRTTRERFAAHTNNPTCAGCHRTLDPIGFGFEDFDGLGKHRTVENGLAVDASGAVELSTGTVPFTGAAALARVLATSDDVGDCVPLQLFRFAMGRDEAPVDEHMLADMRSMFRANPEWRMGDALVGLVRSPYFVHRRTSSPE
ncbi:DUF1592 domain-containing protein [Myxococcus xanthus]|uniref:DUF1592 domain-containing protein n=1 Tax=Myxococcus xanthus TaxID=34 RepID=A0AAE6KUH0_MYXXA|nr:hypothetical protein BHS09_27470 [Myxococcus xanthus]QDE77683.1 hypothetical protein BHS08_27490 [Myxococcus xanthus]QDE99225.1 hypothetical protein BHS05_27275 [Myxococcus xanthus]QDF06920.1 hypothetical protein BHS04_27580 [Myxococcus xanthus]